MGYLKFRHTQLPICEQFKDRSTLLISYFTFYDNLTFSDFDVEPGKASLGLTEKMEPNVF